MKFPREEEDADGKEADGDKGRDEEKEMNKQKFRVHFTAV